MIPHFHNLAALHRACNLPLPEHPMLSLYSFESSLDLFPKSISAFTGDFYCISLKKIKSGKFLYGRTKYDHENGSMIFGKPRQIIALDNIEYEEAGFFISFHKDYILGNSVYKEIQEYGFFDYEVNEALHLSPKEEQTMQDLFNKITEEYYNNQDEMSQGIILAHISSMLKYAQRFYNRQFLNRTKNNSELKSKFDKVLADYFNQDIANQEGLPTVSKIATMLHLSPQYLSDLLKLKTGKTALEHIHIYLINEAKNLLLYSKGRISDIAYQLGFEHTPYFSKLFKKKVGLSPKEYRIKHIN